MSGDKVGVKMGLENVLDCERVLSGERKILVGVALRVNNRCRACRYIPIK